MGLRYWFPWKLARCHVIQQKLPCGFNIEPIVMNFSRPVLLGHMNLPTKNEKNPPRGFGDITITIFSQSQDSLCCLLDR